MTATENVERFFVTLTGPNGEINDVWLEVNSHAAPLDVIQALADQSAPLTSGSHLPVLTFEVDEREDPCPECKTGEVEAVGRAEYETGHQPYACNASCGYHG